MSEPTRQEIIARARRQIAEIDQLHRDVEHWNRRHPNEAPLVADPDGRLATTRTALLQMVIGNGE